MKAGTSPSTPQKLKKDFNFMVQIRQLRWMDKFLENRDDKKKVRLKKK